MNVRRLNLGRSMLLVGLAFALPAWADISNGLSVSDFCKNIFERLAVPYRLNELIENQNPLVKLDLVEGTKGLWTMQSNRTAPEERATALRYYRFLSQQNPHEKLLLGTDVGGIDVPGVDAVRYSRRGYILGNVSFKSIINEQASATALINSAVRRRTEATKSLKNARLDERVLANVRYLNPPGVSAPGDASGSGYSLNAKTMLDDAQQSVHLNVLQRVFGLPLARSHRRSSVVIDMSPYGIAGNLKDFGDLVIAKDVREGVEEQQIRLSAMLEGGLPVSELQNSLKKLNLESYVYLFGNRVVEVSRDGAREYEVK